MNFHTISYRSFLTKIAGVTLIAGLLLGLVMMSGYAQAILAAPGATVTVDTLADENDGSCADGDCSLRDAIATAAAGDTIQFSVAGTIALNPALGSLAVDKNLTIIGPGPDASGIVISGENTFRVFSIFNDTEAITVNLTLMTITKGRETNSGITPSGGGILCGIDPATAIPNPTFLDTLNLDQVDVVDNVAGVSGGGIAAACKLNVTRSVFSRNLALGEAAKIAQGGGILNSCRTTVLNSTFTGNWAGVTTSTNGYGGAITNSAVGCTSSIVQIDFSTFYENRVGGGRTPAAGAIHSVGASSFWFIKNSIFAGSKDAGGSPVFDCYREGGRIVSQEYNLLQNSTGCAVNVGGAPTAHDITGVAADIDGTLALNGGTTKNHIPTGASSNVVDQIPNGVNGCGAISEDQRQQTRPASGACDIGAVELACSAFPIDVANEDELNTAIGCYNAQTVSGTYQITLTGAINLTASSTTIDNTIAGVGLTIEGGGFAVDGQDTAGIRPFDIAANTTVTMNEITVTDGNANGNGGGILNLGNLSINDSTISNNTAQSAAGGGIQNRGSLTVNNSTISGNRARSGGGIYSADTRIDPNDVILTINNSVITGNTAMRTDGGGISNSGDQMTITGSTIANNAANQWGGGIDSVGENVTITGSTINGNTSGGFGGGIYNSPFPVPMTIRNSTISGNTATGARGGGIFSATAGGATGLILDSATITGNTASEGGALYNDGGTVTVKNSILANTTGSVADCENASGGTVTDGGTNLVELQNGCGLTAISTDPNLGPLADNGGSTQTHALNAGSPAIDAGETDLTTDQRGEARPFGPADDIGAYELHCTTPAATAVSISQAGTQVQLDWSDVPGSSEYNVYRSSNAPYFTPAPPPYAGDVSSPWLDPDTTSIGDAANNYFYVVQAANACDDTADSNRVGEFDFTLVPGTP